MEGRQGKTVELPERVFGELLEAAKEILLSGGANAHGRKRLDLAIEDVKFVISRGGGGREVILKHCPECHRFSLDYDGYRALSCFDGHDSADYEAVATLHGPVAEATIRLRHINNLATDEEHQGEVLAAGAESVLGAIGQLAHEALAALTSEQSEGER